MLRSRDRQHFLSGSRVVLEPRQVPGRGTLGEDRDKCHLGHGLELSVHPEGSRNLGLDQEDTGLEVNSPFLAGSLKPSV